jgi:hypothetical protein
LLEQVLVVPQVLEQVLDVPQVLEQVLVVPLVLLVRGRPELMLSLSLF